MTGGHLQRTVVDLKVRRDVWTRKRDLGIINISMVLAVRTVNEVTQRECEKREK